MIPCREKRLLTPAICWYRFAQRHGNKWTMPFGQHHPRFREYRAVTANTKFNLSPMTLCQFVSFVSFPSKYFTFSSKNLQSGIAIVIFVKNQSSHHENASPKYPPLLPLRADSQAVVGASGSSPAIHPSNAGDLPDAPTATRNLTTEI